jgi:hypothetical protein
VLFLALAGIFILLSFDQSSLLFGSDKTGLLFETIQELYCKVRLPVSMKIVGKIE